MSDATQLLELLGRLFGQGEEYEIARRLFDFLEQHNETTYINLQLIRQLTPGAQAGAQDHAIVRTLQFLSGDAVHVLEVGFELFDDQDHAHKLTKDEARSALDLNVNPLTGEEDPEIQRRLAMYFAPTAEAMKTFGNSGSAGA